MRADEITKAVERQCKVVDDALLYDNMVEGNFYHTFDYLKLCGDNGITFNKEKFQFCQMEVEFAGLGTVSSPATRYPSWKSETEFESRITPRLEQHGGTRLELSRRSRGTDSTRSWWMAAGG